MRSLEFSNGRLTSQNQKDIFQRHISLSFNNNEHVIIMTIMTATTSKAIPLENFMDTMNYPPVSVERYARGNKRKFHGRRSGFREARLDPMRRRHRTGRFSSMLFCVLVAVMLATSHAFTTFKTNHGSIHRLHSNGHFQRRHTSFSHTHAALPTSIARMFGTIEWSDLVYDDLDVAFNAWEWFNGLSAPATLVAAAVLVTLAETREETAPRKSDGHPARFLKKMMRFLLLTSFALEVVSIFVGAMTGSILLGHGPQQVAKKIVGYKAPLALLHHHHE
jgi:hypothetical protein